MTDNKNHTDRLHWTGGWFREPVWPREPDIEVVRSLARIHLVNELPRDFNHNAPEVAFFKEGGFNKLYEITYSDHHTSYLLRAAIPMIPYYKTESEVATIAFLRANTSIPLPRVIAWNSNQSNELTFEWIFMEKIGGVTVQNVWRKVSWEDKLHLIDKVAGMITQMRECKFDRIGALFFTSATDIQTIQPEKTVESQVMLDNLTLDEHSDAAGKFRVDSLERCEKENSIFLNREAEISVGQMHDYLFFQGSRLYLPGNRGPYRSSFEMMTAQIQIQLQWIKEGPVDNDSDYGSDFGQEAPKMEALCNDYLECLPKMFDENDTENSYTLHHHDLNAENILVHPETFEILGIVDWELINVVPAWKAAAHPEFLQYLEPFEDEEEPPVPSYENENSIEVEARDRWDYRNLRHHFDKTIERLIDKDRATANPIKVKLARDCEEHIPKITEIFSWAENWLRDYKATGISENVADRSKEFYEDSNSDVDRDKIREEEERKEIEKGKEE